MYNEITDKKIATAMKNGEQTMLTVWRAIKTEFTKFKTSAAGNVLTDEKELQIINKMVLQRKESIEQFRNAGREELAIAEENEMSILLELLPKEATEEDINNAIKEYVTTSIVGTPSMKDMRNIMSFVKSKYPTADGGTISKLFKEKYI